MQDGHVQGNILDDNFDDHRIPVERVELASFWSRVGATLLDGLILSPLIIGLSLYNNFSLKSLPVALLIIVVGILYKILMEWEYGATLGKMIVKIKVVDEQLRSIDLTTSIVRYSIYGLAQIPGILTTLWLFNQDDYFRADGFTEVSMVQQGAPYQWLNLIVGILVLASIIWFFISRHKQTLHDLLAKTLVVTRASLERAI